MSLSVGGHPSPIAPHLLQAIKADMFAVNHDSVRFVFGSLLPLADNSNFPLDISSINYKENYGLSLSRN